MRRMIAIVDKSFPPEHSFVDEFICDEIPKKGIRVTLICSRNKSFKKVGRYKKAIYLSNLLERKRLKRFLNFFVLYFDFIKILQKTRYNNETILFIRNEPIYLLVSYFFKNRFQKIIFQQSFPHELTNNLLKRYITIFIFRYFGTHVDKVIGISEKGIERLKKYFKKTSDFISIPMGVSKSELRYTHKPIGHEVKFIYIGTHNKSRQIKVILEAILSISYEINAKFDFIGGTKKEIKPLKKWLIKKNKFHQINLIPKIPRKDILLHLTNYDIGIGLIPNYNIYAESTATKIVEYASKGLAVLSNYEIEFNRNFILKSNGGYLANFNLESISNKISDICREKDISEKKLNAYNYVKKNYLYELYVEKFLNEVKDE